MKTIDIKSNSRILHWAFYIFLFTVLSVGSVYASEDTPSVLSTNQSEKKTVKGNVMDEYGQPLVGVAVQVKGTSLGVVTDLDGNFSFSIPVDSRALLFSYLGMKTQEVSANKSNYKIVMVEDATQMEEVVVIGYGSQSREKITTSVTKLDKEALKNVPYANAASALQGTVSGVRVQSISGQPGAEPRIIVRGGTSINNPNGATPLYIIDGVMRANMVHIASEDIESIQILKDAAATSIYGAQGSNGVVIVTTKKGKAGKTRVEYRYNLTISDIGKKYEFANAEEFLTLMRKGMISPAKFGKATEQRLIGHLGYGTGNDLTNNTAFSTQYLTDENRYKLDQGWKSMPDPVDPSKTLLYSDTDFQDKIYRTGFSHNHHIEVSGGTEKATFNMGLGYMTNEGTVITTSYKRYNFSLNGSLQARDNLKISARTTYSNSFTYGSPLAADATFYRSPAASPTTKFRFEDGSLAPGAAQYLGNAVYHMNKAQREYDYQNLSIGVDADWTILPGLSFNPALSLFEVNSNNYTFWDAFWNGPRDYITTRNANADTYKWRQYQADAVFNYVKSFNEKHNLNVTAGYAYYFRKEARLAAAGRGASTDLIPTLNASSVPVSVSSSITERSMQGIFARIGYDYKDKYLISVSARYDGASNLGTNNKWGFFPGVSLGWHVDKEKFWSFMPENLMRLKLRASYGVNGNISGLGDYTAQGSYSVGSKYLGNAGITMGTMANQDLSWEESKTFDIGTDISFFNNRLNFIFDYFNRTTDNLLTNRTLPHSTGFGSIFTNLGRLQNRGIELEMNARILPVSSSIQWSLGFNASKVTNKILKLPDNGVENNRIGGEYIWDAKLGKHTWQGGLQEGGRIGDLFAYKMIGVYSTDEEAQNANEPIDNVITVPDKTKYGGDAKWQDTDGNGVIDSKDRVYVGNIYPDWTGGINTSLSYKGFDLYCRLDFTLGHTIYNFAKGFLDYNWQGDNNMTKDVVNRSWKEQGDKADMPRFYWHGDRGQQNAIRGSSLYHESGDFLAIREVSLSYTVPANIIQKIRLSGLRFTVTGNNLHYFTKYSGLNPEEGGQDNGRYAMPRNIIFSANVSF